MGRKQIAGIKNAFKEAFLDNTKYDGFHVEFGEVEGGLNLHFEGTYEFHLIGAAPLEAMDYLGTPSEDSYIFEKNGCEIVAYARDEESACAAFDGFRTFFFAEHMFEDAEQFGIQLAEALNQTIDAIIEYSRKKRYAKA